MLGPANRPNVFTLKASGWTPIEVDRPSLVLPMTVPAGYLMAYPDIRSQAPAAASTSPYYFHDTYIMPGALTCYLPFAGKWSIYNSGTACIVKVQDAGDAPAMMNCGDGAFATADHTEVTAGVASGTALAANMNAVYRLFINDHASNVVYLAIDGAAAVVNTGIRINPGGGSYEMSKKNGNLYKGTVTCIATAASTTLLVTEGGILVPT